MARITMRNSQKATFAEVFEIYISAVTARGVKDKTLATYKQHFHAISKRLDAVDVFDVPINGAAFRRNAAVLQIADDVISGLGVVFIGVFQKVLQNHIGLQLLVGLLAMLGNNLPFQPPISFSGYFLIDNFISHVGHSF